MPVDPWKALEAIPGHSTLPHIWRAELPDHFPAFRILCLKPGPQPGGIIPCPRDCGCYHRIIPRHDRTGAIAICRCLPVTNCPDIPMTLDDATPLQLDRPRLAHALCKALACEPKLANFGPFNTLQIGSWSSAAVPVFLTMQTERRDLHFTVAHLAAVLREKFILLTPTRNLVTADTQQILTTTGAAIFDLASTVAINQDGTLQAVKQPAELFAQFSPESDRPITWQPPKPRYALRKGLGVWHLIFDGQEAFLKHERGLFYVAWLLYHPDQTPIHAIDLMAKVPEIYRQQLGLPAIVDPATGKTSVLESHARLQERSLALDDRQTMRAIYKKEKELEAILDSDDATEPEKAEALRELEEIIEFQRQHGRRSQDAAQRAADGVRKAIARFHARLVEATDAKGSADPVLPPFAAHIAQYLLIPSRHHNGKGRGPARAGLSGRFTYEPPGALRWLSHQQTKEN